MAFFGRTKVVVPVLRRGRMDVGDRAFCHRSLNDSSSNDCGLLTTFKAGLSSARMISACPGAQKLIGNILASDRDNAEVFPTRYTISACKHRIRNGIYGTFSDRQRLAIGWRLPDVKP